MLDDLISSMDQPQVHTHNEELGTAIKDRKMLIDEEAKRAFFWNRIEDLKTKGHGGKRKVPAAKAALGRTPKAAHANAKEGEG